MHVETGGERAVTVRPARERAECYGACRVAAPRLETPYAPHERIAVLVGHGDVRDQDVRPYPLYRLERFGDGRRRRHVGAVAAEGDGEKVPRIGLVVPDDDTQPGADVRIDDGRGFGRRDGLLLGRDRNTHPEPVPMPPPSAVRRYCPAVQLRQVARDVEADPQPAIAPCRRAVRLPETVEDVRQDVRANADAVVPDRDLDGPVFGR